MTELGKKLNYPQTSQIADEATRVYARKLTRVLDDLKSQTTTNLKQYIDELIQNILTIISELDHGNLLGLQDVEDHLYAFLHDASRAFTAHGPGFSDDTALADADHYSAVSEYAIKAYVDALLAYILASPVGSIIYIWEDDGEKFLQRLIPGMYGQVLVTGGPGQRPFWDWVWEAPGGEGSPSIVFYLIVESDVETAKITPDYTVSKSGSIESFVASNLGDETLSVFEDYDPTFDTEVSAAKVTMDYNESVDVSGDLTLEILFSPLQISTYDSIGVTDEVTVQIV